MNQAGLARLDSLRRIRVGETLQMAFAEDEPRIVEACAAQRRGGTLQCTAMAPSSASIRFAASRAWTGSIR
jgi:hypothetical protein